MGLIAAFCALFLYIYILKNSVISEPTRTQTGDF